MALGTRLIGILLLTFFICLVGKETGMALGTRLIFFLIDFLYLSSWKGDGNGTGNPRHCLSY